MHNTTAINVDLGGTEGSKTLYIRSTTKLGNTGTKSVAFYYDIAAPALEGVAERHITEIKNPNAYRNADRVFGGTLTDSNTSAAPTLIFAVNGGATEDIPVVGGVWTYTFDTDARANGIYAVVPRR